MIVIINILIKLILFKLFVTTEFSADTQQNDTQNHNKDSYLMLSGSWTEFNRSFRIARLTLSSSEPHQFHNTNMNIFKFALARKRTKNLLSFMLIFNTLFL